MTASRHQATGGIFLFALASLLFSAFRPASAVFSPPGFLHRRDRAERREDQKTGWDTRKFNLNTDGAAQIEPCRESALSAGYSS
jgi:hypothetical protein